MCLWVSVGRELFFFFFPRLSPCACHACAIRHKTAQIRIFAPHSARWYLCQQRYIFQAAHTNHMHRYLFACISQNPPPLAFLPARALKQESSACVSRYRCPPCVIEDDEEAARVRGYCSWTTYKSKRQSICN